LNSYQIYEQVLRLARGGATRFAVSEFQRLGLSNIRDNEDIMALHGRLYKDIFLSQSGDEALESARLSTEKYEDAFKDTQGFYSGINAATMSLLAGFPEDMVQMRAKRIMAMLPATEDLDSETKYFVEATRAEAHLLLGELKEMKSAMRTALYHDPLNFIAHASTLKQFRMIAAHREVNYEWLSEFQPPIAVHFAGHMFGVEEQVDSSLPCLTEAQIEALKTEISETIQIQDIGFGYGALAAGSDILIAEAILEEGGELHVNLPVSRDLFLKTSVEPYGMSWVPRFNACLEQAISISIVSPESSKSVSFSESQASLASMGAAIRRSESLSVPCQQFLIWDGETGVTGTAADAKKWDVTGRPRIVISYLGNRSHTSIKSPVTLAEPVFTLETKSLDEVQKFDDVSSAISRAIENRQSPYPEIKQVIHFENFEASELLDHALPGSIVLSQKVADYIAVYHFENFSADLIGSFGVGENLYALRKKGR